MKNILLIFAIVIFGYPDSVAQSPDWLWAHNMGGTESEEGTCITTDGNGNSYITGFFNSDSITFGATTLHNTSNVTQDDLFFVKYDSSGTVVWAKEIGGQMYEWGLSVAVDLTGNVYLTGEYSSDSISIGTTTLTNVYPGNIDMFLAKYDPNGNVLWAKSYGGNDEESSRSVTTDTNGNVYITGLFTSPSITFDTIILNNSGYSDVFIVKIDSNGNAIWAGKSVGGSGWNVPQKITADVSGNIYVSGFFNSSSIAFGPFQLNNASTGDDDLFIVKYDSNGNVLWAERAGGLSHEIGYGLATDNNGNVYMTGSFGSASVTFGSTTLTNTGFGRQMFIVKYDSSNNVVWARQSVGSAEEISVAADGIGNTYLTGHFGTTTIIFGSITINAVSGGSNMFVVKYDAGGTEQWAKGIGGNYVVYSKSIAINNNGNVYVTGTFNCITLSFGNTTLTNTSGGTYDVFIAKLDTLNVTGFNDIETIGNGIKLYPNPASQLVFISFSLAKSEKITFKIFDLNGRLVSTLADKIFEAGENKLTWNGGGVNVGIYFLQIQTTDNLQTEKLIVTK